jgi:glycosyltransferase involved in cell wall biosynthesis
MARELDQGGVERDVAKIAMGLDRNRFEPHVATYYATGLRYEELRSAGVPLLHVPLASLCSAQAIQSAMKMRRYIKHHGIKIVHSYDASGVFCIPLARSMRVPVTIASQLSYREILDSRTQWLLRMTDGMADAMLVNCDAIRKYMIEHEHFPADRIELCYNGVATSEFFPAKSPRADTISKASLVIGAVCALRPEKALTLLQEAFSQVRHFDSNMKLVFVGSGPLLASLQENAVRLGIAEANVFIPATREVANWMRSIDIFVLPSFSEAFSNSLLEAMACGCSVVGSRVGGTPELIGSNEERGLLFRSGDVADLAGKLSMLITNVALRRNLATLAARFARENFTIEIAAERTAAIYEKLLQRKTKRQVQFVRYASKDALQ